jgi:hypothetical protein
MAVEVLSDHGLACRLERAEGVTNAHFVEARARLMPESGARWIEVAGAYAMYDGPRSPCTQTFGLGLFQKPANADMDALEAFFEERGAPVIHEVCPLSDKSLTLMLNERGYRPIEFSSVMYMPLSTRVRHAAAETPVRVRVVREGERDLWARTAVAGWREYTEMTDVMEELMRVVAARQDGLSFLAELDGRPIAAGALAIHEGVALLAGASTIAEWRNRGAQRVLLEGRLEYAQSTGCDLAMICAEPGSASQRNAERQGFRIAYTRIKWQLTRAKEDTGI